ncbi:MAG: Ig domain-containing protein, partial [Treponema sp.]|nr:Ig domain-containing protein [Treponema sp.]
TEIETLISEANNVKAGIAVNTDAANVPQGTYWVTQEQMDALNTAITNLQTAKAGGTQTEKDSAYAALVLAIEEFELAMEEGSAPVAVTGVALNKTTLALTVGGEDTLTANITPPNAANTNVTWSTSNASIATVNNGTVTAVSVGTATITVTTVDGSKTASCEVTVTAVAVTGVTLNKTTLTLTAGEYETLQDTVAPGNATNKAVIWSSSNNSVATVDDGTVTAVAAGTATITVTTEDGSKTASCAVTVPGWVAIPNGTGAGTSTFEGYTINSITYANDKFVAVGNRGRMAYSSDGVSWTAVGTTTFNTTVISGITYGGGKFVAVGDSGRMAYSSDGVSWTAIPSGTGAGGSTFSDNIVGITYGNGKFVAVGYNGRMAYSTDGVSWTAVENSTFSGPINGITYGGAAGSQRFVAVDNNLERMAYSTDGVSWTAVENSTFSGPILGITYGGASGSQRFVAVGSFGRMAYSSDGVSWTAIPSGTGQGGSTFSEGIHSITYGNGRFVAVGTSGKMAYSADGISWTAVTDSSFGTSQIRSIVYGGAAGNQKFVAGGANGKLAYSISW